MHALTNSVRLSAPKGMPTRTPDRDSSTEKEKSGIARPPFASAYNLADALLQIHTSAFPSETIRKPSVMELTSLNFPQVFTCSRNSVSCTDPLWVTTTASRRDSAELYTF